MTHKRCPKCQQSKPIDDFCIARRQSSGRQVYCRPCAKVLWEAYCESHPEYRKRRDENYRVYMKTPRGIAARRRAGRKKQVAKYGITVAQYDEMAEQQHYCCATCGKPETYIVRGQLARLSVDHDHATGAVRGLLCNNCNRAMGLLGDNPAVLHGMIDYLTRHGLRIVTASEGG